MRLCPLVPAWTGGLGQEGGGKGGQGIVPEGSKYFSSLVN